MKTRTSVRKNGGRNGAEGLLVRVGPVQPLPDVLRELQQDPEIAFRAAGVDLGWFDDADFRIPMVLLGRLVAIAARLTQRPEMGLLIAGRFGPATLGIVGQLAAEGPNVHTALRNIIRMLHLHDQAGLASLHVMGGHALLKYELRGADFDGADVVLDGAVGICARVVQSLGGPASKLVEVRVSRRKPANTRPYESFFEAPVRYNSAEDGVIFPAAYLKLPVVPPPVPADISKLGSDEQTLADRVRLEVATRVGLDPVDAMVIAAALGLSRRSLDRQLAAEGISCGEIVDEIRYARARRLLAAGDASLSEIGLALGYSELSAFSRAFQKWAGMPPLPWRVNHRLLPGL